MCACSRNFSRYSSRRFVHLLVQLFVLFFRAKLSPVRATFRAFFRAKLCSCSRQIVHLLVQLFVLFCALPRATCCAMLRAHSGACWYIFPTQLAGFGDLCPFFPFQIPPSSDPRADWEPLHFLKVRLRATFCAIQRAFCLFGLFKRKRKK